MSGAFPSHRPPASATSPERVTWWPLMLGGILVVAIAFVMGATGADAPTSVLSASLSGMATIVVLRGVTSPTAHRRMRRRRPAWTSNPQQLKTARGKLAASRAYHVTMLNEKRALRQRLVALRHKMEGVALAAYRPRIENIDVAL